MRREMNYFGFPFSLSSLLGEELSSILENTKNEGVVVVSVIGKSSLFEGSCKAKTLHEATGRNMFNNSMCEEMNIDEDLRFQIEGYYDVESKIIFLHLMGVYDSTYLVQTCKDMEKEFLEKGFLEVWSKLQTKQAKALLFLFQLSHIVMVVHPTCTFDVSYIQLFRTLDAMRQKAIPSVSEILAGFPVSNDWVQAGRPCSPRVLFVFQSCPTEISVDGDNVVAIQQRNKTQPPIKKLEHALEDQIYHILRKSRVITNVSGNSLFAVPANQEFVYVVAHETTITDPVEFFLAQLRDHSAQSKDSDGLAANKSKSYTLNRRGSASISISTSNGSNEHCLTDVKDNHSFKSFLFQHTNLALTKGFDDNVGRHPVAAYFEIPLARTWFSIASKLAEWFFDDSSDSSSKLEPMLDIDVRFSEGRCGKVLPMALAAYQENLPPHYTEEYHQRKLLQALQVFSLQARGPAFSRYASMLKEECHKVWSCRRMCEQLSLTGNHCIHPLHRLKESDEDDAEDLETSKTLLVAKHFSQVKYVCACDCGRRQASREDPFDVKTANYTFFHSLHKECCGNLERIHFPIFEPSTEESRPAIISPALPLDLDQESQEGNEEDEDLESESKSNSCEDVSHSPSVEEENVSEEFFPEGSLSTKFGVEETNLKEETSSSHKVVISIVEGSENVPKMERYLPRQHSTTEYLPGMLHSESPLGLLPTYPSWSLLCLGPSSLYSHNIGIQDQPGFLTGTNFLLPWDVTVKVEQKERWNNLWEGKRISGIKNKKSGRDGSQFTVKIFVGIEYECPRSHRFMCSAPDKVLRPTGTGLVKDNANKVTGSDMPLYFPCPCRPSKPNIAQLMRIHIVTPKAPVQVTLNPKVQPAPAPCPIFFPGNSEPVKLSQSAYWVLRLPFIYEGSQGPYLPPKEALSVESCRLLKGTYGIAQVLSEKS